MFGPLAPEEVPLRRISGSINSLEGHEELRRLYPPSHKMELKFFWSRLRRRISDNFGLLGLFTEECGESMFCLISRCRLVQWLSLLVVGSCVKALTSRVSPVSPVTRAT